MPSLLIRIVLTACLGAGVAPSGIEAQMPITSSLDLAQAADGAAAASVQSGTSSGLPARTPPPRTMSDQWLVFVLFTIIWLALVAYTLSFNGRLKRIAAGLSANHTRADQSERSTLR